MKKWTFHMRHVKCTHRRSDGPYWCSLKLEHRRLFSHFFSLFHFLLCTYQMPCKRFVHWNRQASLEAQTTWVGPGKVFKALVLYLWSGELTSPYWVLPPVQQRREKKERSFRLVLYYGEFYFIQVTNFQMS